VDLVLAALERSPPADLRAALAGMNLTRLLQAAADSAPQELTRRLVTLGAPDAVALRLWSRFDPTACERLVLAVLPDIGGFAVTTLLLAQRSPAPLGPALGIASLATTLVAVTTSAPSEMSAETWLRMALRRAARVSGVPFQDVTSAVRAASNTTPTTPRFAVLRDVLDQIAAEPEGVPSDQPPTDAAVLRKVLAPAPDLANADLQRFLHDGPARALDTAMHRDLIRAFARAVDGAPQAVLGWLRSRTDDPVLPHRLARITGYRVLAKLAAAVWPEATPPPHRAILRRRSDTPAATLRAGIAAGILIGLDTPDMPPEAAMAQGLRDMHGTDLRDDPRALPRTAPAEVGLNLAVHRSVIDNAGLVLMWPDLPVLFARLGYLHDGAFSDAAQQRRAVHLLHAAVAPEAPWDEPALVLNKILCGLDPTDPADPRLRLEAHEIQMIDSLLAALCQRWPPLRNTSVAGLRETFLQRRGVIARPDQDGPLTLQVETGPFDILLDRLPWPISLVRTPWMREGLFVSWR